MPTSSLVVTLALVCLSCAQPAPEDLVGADVGESCTSDLECEVDLICAIDATTCEGPNFGDCSKTCSETCEEDAGCALGRVCADECGRRVCRAPSPLGESCVSSRGTCEFLRPCDLGLACDGRCRLSDCREFGCAEGDFCVFDGVANECDQGDAHRCVSPVGEGEVCARAGFECLCDIRTPCQTGLECLREDDAPFRCGEGAAVCRR